MNLNVSTCPSLAKIRRALHSSRKNFGFLFGRCGQKYSSLFKSPNTNLKKPESVVFIPQMSLNFAPRFKILMRLSSKNCLNTKHRSFSSFLTSTLSIIPRKSGWIRTSLIRILRMTHLHLLGWFWITCHQLLQTKDDLNTLFVSIWCMISSKMWTKPGVVISNASSMIGNFWKPAVLFLNQQHLLPMQWICILCTCKQKFLVKISIIL